MELKFTIEGNQEDMTGNPIPYQRSTQRTFWAPDDRRYQAWKDFVRANYRAQVKMAGLPVNISHNGNGLKNTQGKPIELEPKQKARMEIKITFKNWAHADPDNIWKGIADALFIQDKNVTGSFDFEVNPEQKRPSVEVTLTI